MPSIHEEEERTSESDESNCTYHHLVQGEIMPHGRSRKPIALLRARTDLNLEKFENNFGMPSAGEAPSPLINLSASFLRNISFNEAPTPADPER
jgi:hypothetical protein